MADAVLTLHWPVQDERVLRSSDPKPRLCLFSYQLFINQKERQNVFLAILICGI